MGFRKKLASVFRTLLCRGSPQPQLDEEKVHQHHGQNGNGAGSAPVHQIDYTAYRQWELEQQVKQHKSSRAHHNYPPRPSYTSPNVIRVEQKALPAVPPQVRVSPQYTYQYYQPKLPPVKPHVQVPVQHLGHTAVQRVPTPPPLVHRLDYASSPRLPVVKAVSAPSSYPEPKVVRLPLVEKRSEDAANIQSSTHYQSLRKRAADEGDAMARSFNESQEAYKAKNGAQAKVLSERGKRHKAEMERLNKQASEWIYRELNLNSAPDEIDLHGQFVSEAIGFAEKAVRAAQRRGDGQLRVIVGKGLHSQADPKLKPAIEKHMTKLRLQSSLDPRNAGVLVVNLA